MAGAQRRPAAACAFGEADGDVLAQTDTRLCRTITEQEATAYVTGMTAALGRCVQGSRRMLANPRRPVPLVPCCPRVQDLGCLQTPCFSLPCTLYQGAVADTSPAPKTSPSKVSDAAAGCRWPGAPPGSHQPRDDAAHGAATGSELLPGCRLPRFTPQTLNTPFPRFAGL